MKKYSGILLIALAMMLVLPACKKYPDGPMISLRSKKARVVNKWVIEKVFAAGLDITAAFNTNQQNYMVEFKDDGTYIESFKSGNSQQTVNGTWDLSSNKESLNMENIAVSYSWEILRLKNDELWLKSNILGVIQEWHLVTQ